MVLLVLKFLINFKIVTLQKWESFLGMRKDRNSIILFYYTKDERPSELNIYKDPHSDLWIKKDTTEKRGNIIWLIRSKTFA